MNANIYPGESPMKNSARSWWQLSVLILLCGFLLCGCGGGTYPRTSAGTPDGAGGVVSPPPSSGSNIEGNWHFSMTSAVSGTPPLSIDGSISPSSSSVSAAVHINGSKCFDPLNTVGLTGTLTGSNLSLTSTSVDGQIATFTGNIADDTLTATHVPGQFTGTYTINGGCAGGDEGNVTGAKESSMTRSWAGDLTSETGDTNRIAVDLVQGNPTQEGTFGLTGTAFFEVGRCFTSGKIVSGTFPSGSYIVGNSVSLEIETDNGVIVFLGKPSGGVIHGNYTLVGSTCEPAGTGYLSPWEY
jgi:hypothetical protein